MRIHSVAVQPLAVSHRVPIEPFASHPIADTLGLGRGPLVPRAQLKLHIDAATIDVEPTRERA